MFRPSSKERRLRRVSLTLDLVVLSVLDAAAGISGLNRLVRQGWKTRAAQTRTR